VWVTHDRWNKSRTGTKEQEEDLMTDAVGTPAYIFYKGPDEKGVTTEYYYPTSATQVNPYNKNYQSQAYFIFEQDKTNLRLGKPFADTVGNYASRNNYVVDYSSGIATIKYSGGVLSPAEKDTMYQQVAAKEGQNAVNLGVPQSYVDQAAVKKTETPEALSVIGVTTIGATNSQGLRYTGVSWVDETTYRGMVDAGAFAPSSKPPVGYVGGTYNPVTGETTGGHPSQSDLSKAGSSVTPITNNVQYIDVGIPALPIGKNDIPIISTKVNTDAPYYESTEGVFYNLKASTLNEMSVKALDDAFIKPLPEGYTYGDKSALYSELQIYKDDINKLQLNDKVYQDSKSGSIFIDDQFIPSASMRAAGIKFSDEQGKVFDEFYQISKSQAEQYFNQPAEQKPEEPKNFSVGGFISDFTKAYGAGSKGDFGSAYEYTTQAFSRFTTRPFIPDPTGLGDYIKNLSIPSNYGPVKTPIGTLKESVGYGVEQLIQDIRKDPIQDMILLAIPGGFSYTEAGGSALRGAAVRSELGVISTGGKLLSTPYGVDLVKTVWSSGKVILGGLYAADSINKYNTAKTPEEKGRVIGDVTYQVGLMKIGSDYFNPTFPAENNPSLSYTMKGEYKTGPITKLNDAMIVKVAQGELLLRGKPAESKVLGDYFKAYSITRDIKPYNPEAKVNLWDLTDVPAEHADRLNMVLSKNPHALYGSGTMGAQGVPLELVPKTKLGITPSADADMFVNTKSFMGDLSNIEGAFTKTKTIDATLLKPAETIITDVYYGGYRFSVDPHDIPANYPKLPGETLPREVGISYEPEYVESIAFKLLGDPFARSPQSNQLTYHGELGKEGYQNFEQADVGRMRYMDAMRKDLFSATTEGSLGRGARYPKDVVRTSTSIEDAILTERLKGVTPKRELELKKAESYLSKAESYDIQYRQGEEIRTGTIGDLKTIVGENLDYGMKMFGDEVTIPKTIVAKSLNDYSYMKAPTSAKVEAFLTKIGERRGVSSKPRTLDSYGERKPSSSSEQAERFLKKKGESTIKQAGDIEPEYSKTINVRSPESPVKSKIPNIAAGVGISYALNNVKSISTKYSSNKSPVIPSAARPVSNYKDPLVSKPSYIKTSVISPNPFSPNVKSSNTKSPIISSAARPVSNYKDPFVSKPSYIKTPVSSPNPFSPNSKSPNPFSPNSKSPNPFSPNSKSPNPFRSPEVSPFKSPSPTSKLSPSIITTPPIKLGDMTGGGGGLGIGSKHGSKFTEKMKYGFGVTFGQLEGMFKKKKGGK
jgi:hypothetical protein